jgi:hypothetical protein
VVTLFGILLQKASERFETVFQALAIVEPIYSNDQLAASKTLLQSARRPGFYRANGHVPQCRSTLHL